MKLAKDQCYKILGLPQTSAWEEIKKRYRKMALQYHPDKTSHLNKAEREKKTEEFKLISNAYDKLGKSFNKNCNTKSNKTKNYADDEIKRKVRETKRAMFSASKDNIAGGNSSSIVTTTQVSFDEIAEVAGLDSAAIYKLCCKNELLALAVLADANMSRRLGDYNICKLAPAYESVATKCLTTENLISPYYFSTLDLFSLAKKYTSVGVLILNRAELASNLDAEELNALACQEFDYNKLILAQPELFKTISVYREWLTLFSANTPIEDDRIKSLAIDGRFRTKKLADLCKKNVAVALAIMDDATLAEQLKAYLHEIAMTHESVALKIILSESLLGLYQLSSSIERELPELVIKYPSVAAAVINNSRLLAILINDYKILNELAKRYPKYEEIQNNLRSDEQKNAYQEWQQLSHAITALNSERIVELLKILQFTWRHLFYLCCDNYWVAQAVIANTELTEILSNYLLACIASRYESVALAVVQTEDLWKRAYFNSSFGRDDLFDTAKKFHRVAEKILENTALATLMGGENISKLLQENNSEQLYTIIANNLELMKQLQAYAKILQGIEHDTFCSEGDYTQSRDNETSSDSVQDHYQAGLTYLKSAPLLAARFFALAAMLGHRGAMQELETLADKYLKSDYIIAIAEIYADTQGILHDKAKAANWYKKLAIKGEVKAVNFFDNVLSTAIKEAYSAERLKEILDNNPYLSSLEELANEDYSEAPASIQQKANIALSKIYQLRTQQFYKFEEYGEAINNSIFNREDYRAKKANLNILRTLFSPQQTSAHRQEIFGLLQGRSAYFNQRRNPKWDRFWGKQHTTGWQKIWKDIRQQALVASMAEVDGLETHEQKIEHLKWAREQDMFKKHRSNFWFTGAWGRTSAVKAIDTKIAELNKLQHPLSRSWCCFG